MYRISEPDLEGNEYTQELQLVFLVKIGSALLLTTFGCSGHLKLKVTAAVMPKAAAVTALFF